jgi:hypothetical protein
MRGRGLALFVGIVGLFVIGAALFGAIVQPPGPFVTDTTPPEYDTGEVYQGPPGTDGTITPTATVEDQTMVIDEAHDNRFEHGDVRPLIDGATQAGFDVEYLEAGDDVDEALDGAAVLVVVDPATAYSADDAAVVEEFVDGGGQLLLVGEPSRSELTVAGPFAVDITTAHSETTTLSTRFGIEFGTGYLYDLEENEGHYRTVGVTAPDGTPLADDVDRAVVSTATTVTAADGEPLLVTDGDARHSETRATGEYVVAAADGNVVAIGDTSMFTNERHTIGDNEAVVTALIDRFAEGAQAVAVDTAEAVDTDETDVGEHVLTVTVEDEAGEPVEGAIVALADDGGVIEGVWPDGADQAETDEDGTVEATIEFDEDEEAEYTVLVEHEDYEDGEEGVTVPEDEDVTVVLEAQDADENDEDGEQEEQEE